MRKNKIKKDINRIIEVIEHIDRRSDKPDVNFMCSELIDKVRDLEKEVLEDE